MMIKCPPIDPALIAYLDSVFPDHAVNPKDTDPAVAYGKACVVRHLRVVMENQEEREYVST